MTAVATGEEDEEPSNLEVPGYKNYLIYADESGTRSRQGYYGFGLLCMPYERRGDFYARVRELKQRHRKSVSHEVKWVKTVGTNLDLYKDLADYVLRARNIFFQCIVIPRALVDVTLHGRSWDVARRKHFGKFLHKRINFFNVGTEKRLFHVRVDAGYSEYEHASEVHHKILNAQLKNDPNVKHPAVTTFSEVDSKKSQGVQLCDLMLGAVMAARQNEARTRPKLILMDHIAARLGWDDLNCYTYPKELRFNIWCWYPTGGAQLDGLEPRRIVSPFVADAIYTQRMAAKRR